MKLCSDFEVVQHATFSAMDALAQTLMKAVVNCNNHYDLQNSVKQLVVECGMCF